RAAPKRYRLVVAGRGPWCDTELLQMRDDVALGALLAGTARVAAFIGIIGERRDDRPPAMAVERRDSEHRSCKQHAHERTNQPARSPHSSLPSGRASGPSTVACVSLRTPGPPRAGPPIAAPSAPLRA